MSTSKAKWENPISLTKVELPVSPNPRGRKIDCLSGRGCGNKVAKSIGICRDCRRAGKRHIAKIAYRQRKDAAKKGDIK